MKVCIVRPPILVPKFNMIAVYAPPLGPALVAAALRERGHEVSVVDGLGEDIDKVYDFESDCVVYGMYPEEIAARIPRDADVIGVSLNFSFEWPLYQRVIKVIRQSFPDTLIIVGGEHATAISEYTLQTLAAEVCVLGEGEETMVELADHLSSGKRNFAEIAGLVYRDPDGTVHRTGRRERIRELDSIPRAAWDLVPIEEYLKRGYGHGVERGRSMPILASRGCPYQCTFCSNPLMWTTRWNVRSSDHVLAEIRDYIEKYNANNFDFYDLTAIVKRDWIVEFCNKIIAEGLKFTWQLPSGTRSEAIDDKVASLLYASGCRNLSYAPESGSPRIHQLIKKKIKLDRMIESIDYSRQAGIIVKINIIVGFPDETFQDVLQTFWFTVRLAWAGVYDYTMFTFSPYPGSELFDRLIKEGKIEINEPYFDSLRSYTDVSKTTSYCERMSHKQLLLIRTFGTLLFYSLMFLRRPWRLISMIRNIARGEVLETRTEKGIASILQRFGLYH